MGVLVEAKKVSEGLARYISREIRWFQLFAWPLRIKAMLLRPELGLAIVLKDENHI